MSYLLDALRKSDEERKKHRQQSARTRVSFTTGETRQKKNRRYFGLILSGVMALIALTLAAGWWWSQEDASAPVKANVAKKAGEASPLDSGAERPGEVLAPADEQGPEKPGSKLTLEPEPATEPAGEILSLTDLSAELKSALPEMQFSGHVYSPSPELRLIMINDSVVREGDQIGPNLLLEEITAEGVILRSGQTSFKVKLF